MKKVLLLCISLMLGFSVLRLAVGSDSPQMTLTRFLSVLSSVDLDFEHTINSITLLRNQLLMPNLPKINALWDVFEYVAGLVDYIFALSTGILGTLVSVVVDILDFLYSIVMLFNRLIYS